MSYMLLILAVLLSAIWLFLSGAVIFAVVLPHWFQQHFGAIARDPKSLPLWAVGVEKLLQGLGLTLMVHWTTVSLTHLAVIAVLLVSCTYLFSTYANYKVAGRPVLTVAILDAMRIIVGLVIVAAFLGRNRTI